MNPQDYQKRTFYHEHRSILSWQLKGNSFDVRSYSVIFLVPLLWCPFWEFFIKSKELSPHTSVWWIYQWGKAAMFYILYTLLILSFFSRLFIFYVFVILWLTYLVPIFMPRNVTWSIGKKPQTLLAWSFSIIFFLEKFCPISYWRTSWILTSLQTWLRLMRWFVLFHCVVSIKIFFFT